MLKHNVPKRLLKLARPIVKPKLFYLFFVLIFLQQSCTKIDNIEKLNKIEISATDFFHSSKPLSVGISQIVEKLKKEDLRSNFVKDLPKDCGLPIWDKLVIQRETNDVRNNASARENNTASTAGGASSDVIIVPLTLTNNSLSSILVATELNDSSWLISTKVVNHYLYYVTHTASVDTSFSKKALALFLFVENNTFGTTIFHNIPANLFPSIPFVDQNGNKDLTILNFDASQYDSLGTPIMSSRAMAFISHEPPPEGIGHVPLLWGSSWLYQGCSYCPPPGWPSGGGGGGGGNPPPNPIGGGGCPWYNPNCNVPPPPPPGPLNPCNYMIQLSADANFINNIKSLNVPAVLNANYEKGYTVNNRLTNSYTPVQGAFTNTPEITWSITEQVDGLLHCHYAGLNNVPSPEDIVFMARIFLKGLARDSNNLFLGVTNNANLPLIVKVNNVAKFRAFAITIAGIDGDDLKKAKKFIETYTPLFNTANFNQNIVEFLKMIKKKAGDNGMALMKADDETCTSWSKLSLKSIIVGQPEDYENNPCPVQ